MSLQTPSYDPPQTSLPRPHPHLTNRARAYDIISTNFSIAQLSLAITATVKRSPLSILFLSQTPELDLGGLKNEAVFMQDFATSLDPTCRYTFLNYLSEEGMLGEWMAKGEMNPSMEEWTEYVRWCVKVVREEGWVDFSEGSVEGAEQRGNGRAIDLMVSGEMFKADIILDGSEESMTFANESEELDMLQATDALQNLCAAVSSTNLASLTTQNEKLLSQYEKEQASRMVRALL
ncbi:putative lysine ornithine n-monooxygenase protein [Botrytis fragariae]|uniref:L-ornithine N(5)-monooxygenase [NAD(P)H] n=1 Tax=Botrytis fragariae TaxID=1964551 RepID=A0A8H6AJZ4_9HELO|nr:putative lysine ornithine n-monooxygenase protein [Botrytis fragariae]KAF5868700.1 putative lysine ornithine n-monooxygenase protein [Botrytis fragariae]